VIKYRRLLGVALRLISKIFFTISDEYNRGQTTFDRDANSVGPQKHKPSSIATPAGQIACLVIFPLAGCRSGSSSADRA
jgi:hypothetical protein